MGINIERVKEKHKALADIGALPDGGVSRLALTKEDAEGRHLLKKWITDIGADFRMDDLGNMYGWIPGTKRREKPVVVGSHLDSVPSGGTFDGVIGVLAGLEIMTRLKEEGIESKIPFALANFTNEEGARFPISMIGSGVLSGKYTKEKMESLTDKDGISMGEELQRFGLAGEASNRLTDVEAFAEIHIEQGPILEKEEKTIGIVNGIQGLSWYEVQVVGESDHAGPTPMKIRKDPLIAATKVIQSLHQWVCSLNDETTITFGSLSVKPDVVNVISGKLTFTIDIRHPDGEILESREKEMHERLKAAMETEPIDSWEINPLSKMLPVEFHQPFLQQIEQICKSNGYTYRHIVSGAGHDAMYMNRLAPTFMLFVPSVGGKSHHPAEKSHWEDIEASINVLYDWVKQQIG
ncbi:Zn-dependent hydrolase [Virgibacillus sp. W0181]|uniref:Zn-dependent hydrolase n=1 Tax=Virgibacillus sp. W0181 TaxID=3391581 RepID=UPI003F460C95